ncbi:protein CHLORORESPIRATORY REDUCTION 41, chloroplastic [Ziziphus jujuba]|uniref:Protein CHLORORESPIRATORY REDUCTION 41, chloroplastic n=1 Tax=Ziziphus jujuba TaxID=326968 RepID=A0A6P4B783_ZIZJJ|nr:protein CHLORORESPIRATORY REDUCTION 41, chloroplastic [Ziziphus jujuba]
MCQFCVPIPKLAMASTVLQALSHPNSHALNHLFQTQIPKTFTNPSQFHIHNPLRTHFFIKCTNSSASNPTPQPDFPTPNSETTTSSESFPIEKRRKSEIVRDRKSKSGLVKPEPPNFEIGWKRTKQIQLEKPKGFVIADFLEKLEVLMGREFGSKELLAKAGEIVAERAREEAEVLRDEGEVEDRLITELFRVLRLMEMDLAMVKAAAKEETLSERLEQAKARCRQTILVALSF